MNEGNVLDINLVIRAMQGDEAAFREIYNITYQNKFYIAKKYMKNDAAAEDVLQDAYIKIWVNLPSLDKPESFQSWSSRIVANTALNELRKNQPLLFSEMAGEGDDGSELAFEVEDNYVPNQPELSFTEQEEQNIVREMIDSLSDDQRMCIMMYYMEELGVREIAETLGCSEGTVKSRLNYGRKNIKLKAEELQKKGYNFKGISALALLLLLLKREAAKAGAAPVAVSSGAMPLAGNIAGGMYQGAPQGAAGGYGAAPQGAAGGYGAAPQGAAGGYGAAPQGAAGGYGAAGEAAKAGVKGAFAKTAAGKAIIALVSIAAIVGTIAIVMLVKDKQEDSDDTPVVTTEAQVTETMATPDSAVTEVSTEELTEEVVEEPAEDYAYIDEYERILQENSTAIQAYETYSGLYSEPEKTVAIIDAFGDKTPELFFLTSDYPNYSSESGGDLNAYTMVDGKAVFVKKDMYVSTAGSSQPNKVFTSKSKEGFYWEYIPPHGVGELNQVTKKIGYSIAGSQTDEHSILHSSMWDEEGTGRPERNDYYIDDTATDEASYQAAMAAWEADYGEVIFDNWDRYSSNGGETVTYDYQYSYADAVNKLAELKNSLEGGNSDSQNTGEMTNDKAHAMGDELLSDFYDVTQKDAFSEEGRAAYEAFAEKYHISMMMPTGTGVNYLSTDSYEYSYYDINNDGIDELFISHVAIVSFKNGNAVNIEAATGATNVGIACLKNGHIIISSQGMVWAPQTTEYELAADGISLNFIDGVKVDGSDGRYYKCGSNGENLEEITEEQYTEIINSREEIQLTYLPLTVIK
ncbi:MAG: sigma-70 family RNA polymerase sigma factor [Lachnospiraceae bacterium]|nr:sigma-70 family RNA polymerase sigma factor [Lachnospiraceae bacterium]